MTTSLAGRTAVITGGGSGLGAAIARSLHASGAEVILVGRNEAALAKASADLGSRARWLLCDVADPSSVAQLGEELSDSEVSILINNAGVAGPVAALTDVAPDDWDDVFAVNVRGTFLMCQAILPGMIQRGHGDIVNIASVSGKRPLAHRTPYCASKMAVIGLTSTLAFEVGSAGIKVNSLSPGPVVGPRMERNFRLEAQRAGSTVDEAEHAFVSRAALGRMVSEEEVGNAVVAMITLSGLSGADIDLSAGMVA